VILWVFRGNLALSGSSDVTLACWSWPPLSIFPSYRRSRKLPRKGCLGIIFGTPLTVWIESVQSPMSNVLLVSLYDRFLRASTLRDAVQVEFLSWENLHMNYGIFPLTIHSMWLLRSTALLDYNFSQLIDLRPANLCSHYLPSTSLGTLRNAPGFIYVVGYELSLTRSSFLSRCDMASADTVISMATIPSPHPVLVCCLLNYLIILELMMSYFPGRNIAGDGRMMQEKPTVAGDPVDYEIRWRDSTPWGNSTSCTWVGAAEAATSGNGHYRRTFNSLRNFANPLFNDIKVGGELENPFFNYQMMYASPVVASTFNFLGINN